MKEKLTVSNIKTFQFLSLRYDVFDTDLSGLRVKTSGTKKFRRQKIRYPIGKYGSITLVQAKEIAQKMMTKVIQGVDIQQENRQFFIEAKNRAQIPTFANFIKQHYEDCCKQHRKT
jgi:hypothetical protein